LNDFFISHGTESSNWRPEHAAAHRDVRGATQKGSRAQAPPADHEKMLVNQMMNE